MAQQSLPYGAVDNDPVAANRIANREAWKRTGEMFTDIYSVQSRTINAGDVRFAGGATTEARIQLAINQAVIELAARVYVPAFMLPYDASLVTFSNSVQMVREGGNAASWDVLAYGAVGTEFPTIPSADSTTAIQAALNTGHSVDLCGLSYVCHGLTQNTNDQVIYSSSGQGRLSKNANGDLFTSTADRVQCRNIEFRGDAPTPVYTGHNVVATGDYFSLINCGSRYAYGRAVKATGNRLQIIGSQDIYQTADQTATGYDLEVGISGTNTLYHNISGLDTTQHTGGILLIDTGSHTIVGGKFGKLTIQRGTGPAGCNGGKTVGARINGDVTVELASATFTCNQFSATITFAATANACRLDDSNTFDPGSVIVNNGNTNNLLVRQTSAGSGIGLQYGGDASLATVTIVPNVGRWDFPAKVGVANGSAAGFITKQANGTDGGQVYMDASNQLWVNNNVTGKNAVLMTAGTGGFVGLAPNQAYALQCDASAVATNTRMLLYDVDKGALSRVSVGANDSGGAGFKVLRVPN